MSVSLIIAGKSENNRIPIDERTLIPHKTRHQWKVRHFTVPKENADEFVDKANQTHQLYSKISKFTLSLGLLTFAGGVAASLINGLAILCGAKIHKKTFFKTLAVAMTGLVGGTALTYGVTELNSTKYKNLKDSFDVREAK